MIDDKYVVLRWRPNLNIGAMYSPRHSINTAASRCCGAVRRTSLFVSQGSEDQVRANVKVEICPLCRFACYHLVLIHLPQSSECYMQARLDLLGCALSVLMQDFSAKSRMGKKR